MTMIEKLKRLIGITPKRRFDDSRVFLDAPCVSSDDVLSPLNPLSPLSVHSAFSGDDTPSTLSPTYHHSDPSLSYDSPSYDSGSSSYDSGGSSYDSGSYDSGSSGGCDCG